MELHFPRASRSSHLPSILPSVAAASFWLVVAFKSSTGGQLRPRCILYYIFFVDQFAALNDGMVSPHVLPVQRASALTPPLPLPPTIGLIVV